MRQDGKIDYVEFPATELPATKQFYQTAFGWSFIDYGPSYAAIDPSGRAAALLQEKGKRASAVFVVRPATM